MRRPRRLTTAALVGLLATGLTACGHTATATRLTPAQSAAAAVEAAYPAPTADPNGQYFCASAKPVDGSKVAGQVDAATLQSEYCSAMDFAFKYGISGTLLTTAPKDQTPAMYTPFAADVDPWFIEKTWNKYVTEQLQYEHAPTSQTVAARASGPKTVGNVATQIFMVVGFPDAVSLAASGVKPLPNGPWQADVTFGPATATPDGKGYWVITFTEHLVVPMTDKAGTLRSVPVTKTLNFAYSTQNPVKPWSIWGGFQVGEVSPFPPK